MDEELDSDEIPVIEPEVLPEGANVPGGSKKRSSGSWVYGLLVRVCCLFVWLIMAWSIVLVALLFLLMLIASVFSPRLAERRPAFRRLFANYLVHAVVLMIGGLIGLFSPGLAARIVKRAWAAMGISAQGHPFRRAWDQSMGRYS